MANRLITPEVVTATEYSKLIFLQESTISFIDSSFGYEEVDEIVIPEGTILEGNFENVLIKSSGKVIGTPVNRKLRNKIQVLRPANILANNAESNVNYCWGLTTGDNRFLHYTNKFLRIIDVESLGIDTFSNPGNLALPIKNGLYTGIEINRLLIPSKGFNKEKTILVNLYETDGEDLDNLKLVGTSYLQGMIDYNNFNTDSISQSFADFDGVRIRSKSIAVEIVIPQEINKVYSTATLIQEEDTDGSNSFIITTPCGIDEWTPISVTNTQRDITVGVIGRRVKPFPENVAGDDLPFV